MATILLVDDESASLQIMEEAIREIGHRPIPVRNVEAALRVLERGGVDLVVSDYRMPGATGLEFLEMMQKAGFDVGLIMVTGYASIEHAVSSIKAGAVDYLTKPFRAQELGLAVDQALEYIRLRRENDLLRREVVELRSSREIIGGSASLQRVLETIRSVAPTKASVLIQGESGTGKELLARAVHNFSDRASGPFVSVNCAALPDNLVESILFGHEKGAFTGAIKDVKGAFERAHRGTLLLDEVTEMKPEMQAKLLRALQEQEFERLGAATATQVDVRIVSTTNRDLAQEIEQGRFREDLYFRLSVVPVRVPSLRERPEDIPELVAHFLDQAAVEAGKRLEGILPDALEVLCAYRWPGNVRELAHTVKRAAILSRGAMLEVDDFDPARHGLSLPVGAPGSGPIARKAKVTLPPSSDHFDSEAHPEPSAGIRLTTLNLGEAEALLIQRALEMTQDNRTHAADLLGIHVRTLRNKLNRPE
jgi:two-component system response regulator HydG